jgi:hypothetical protein
MWKLIIKKRSLLSGMVLYGLGGCVSSQQLADLARTEFARVTSDLIGQLFAIFVQATSPLAGL